MENSCTNTESTHSIEPENEAIVSSWNLECLQLSFPTIDCLEKYVEDYATSLGFKVKHSYNYNTVNDSSEKRGNGFAATVGTCDSSDNKENKNPKGKDLTNKFVCRGRFMCCQCGIFNIPFSSSKIAGVHSVTYFIVKGKYNSLNTTHESEECFKQQVPIMLGNDILITKESDVTSEEMYIFTKFGPYCGADLLRVMLRERCPNRQFDKNLIQRLILKGRTDLYGKDPDRLQEFLKKCIDVTKDGGVFDFKLDETGRIRCVYIQLKSMQAYTGVYKDFIQLDGTHKLNVYDLNCITWVLVDCLGKFILCSMALLPSEQSDDIVHGSKLFKLDDPNSVSMSDEGPGLILHAEKLNQHHLLCLKHFNETCFTVKP